MSVAIKVENLSKAYRIGEIGTGTLYQDLQRWWARQRGHEDPYLKIGEANDREVKGTSDVVWSLKDINFEIQQGDAVGIIGRNGAGKSTLLKILSRITSPTSGSINGKGRIASLLEVGTGFHPELTGRENIFLNGAILGMRKKEIKRKFDEIVDFSGVERYIDTPVKRYSSGMYVRLAFAVAAYLESEILIVDEVLAVGDAEFQKKCLGKMGEVSKGEGRTVLFVSHDLNAIKTFCVRSLLLINGEVNIFDKTLNVITQYLANDKSYIYSSPKKKGEGLFVEQIVVSDFDNIPKAVFQYDEDVYIRFNISGSDFEAISKSNLNLFITIKDIHTRRVFSAERILDRQLLLKIKGHQLTKGTYYMDVLINIAKHGPLESLQEAIKFEIIDDSSWMIQHGDHDCGNVFGNYEWL